MNGSYPRLVFLGDTDEDIEYTIAHAPMKQWCPGSAEIAEISEGELYPVQLLTPLRAAQDMAPLCKPLIKTGLLVVPDTELVTMEAVIEEAA